MRKLINRIVHFFLVLLGKRVYPIASLLQQGDTHYYFILVDYQDGRALLVDEYEAITCLKLEDLKNNFTQVTSIYFNNTVLEIESVGNYSVMCEGQQIFTLTELNEGV